MNYDDKELLKVSDILEKLPVDYTFLHQMNDKFSEKKEFTIIDSNKAIALGKATYEQYKKLYDVQNKYPSLAWNYLTLETKYQMYNAYHSKKQTINTKLNNKEPVILTAEKLNLIQKLDTAVKNKNLNISLVNKSAQLGHSKFLHYQNLYEQQQKIKKASKKIKPYQSGSYIINVNSYWRYHPQANKMVWVKSHIRHLQHKIPKVVKEYLNKNPTSFAQVKNAILEKQHNEKDWSYQSSEYPNIIGLSDTEINNFISKHPKNEQEYTKEYIQHITCLNDNDIETLSEKMFKQWHSYMKDTYTGQDTEISNHYDRTTTIFLTSAKGGFEVQSRFAYANALNKQNFPYDLRKSYNETLESRALPYGSSISDVNDIVYIDDIYMSGEQGQRALTELKRTINSLVIKKGQKPRLHYMALVYNTASKLYTLENTAETISKFKSKYKPKLEQYEPYDIIVDKSIPKSKGNHFNTFTFGSNYDFDDKTAYNYSSAVVFPFSIPDGSRMKLARQLYKEYNKFPYRATP